MVVGLADADGDAAGGLAVGIVQAGLGGGVGGAPVEEAFFQGFQFGFGADLLDDDVGDDDGDHLGAGLWQEGGRQKGGVQEGCKGVAGGFHGVPFGVGLVGLRAWRALLARAAQRAARRRALLR